MSDSSNFSNFAAQNQPWTDIVNQRMQRIQELERLRQESHAAHPSSNNTDRHSRREMIIQSTSRQDRRGQRAALRSQSFDNNSDITLDGSFREAFESSRQMLFGSRLTGSSENLYGSLMNRRDSDTTLAQRTLGQQGSDSGSDSSISNSYGNRGESNLLGSFNRASPLLGSDTNLNREPRSSSVTREARDSSTNRRRMRTHNMGGEPSLASRLLSAREGRSRESRRRRTLQGADRNVAEALEREKVAFEPLSRLSPNFMASSDTDSNKSASTEHLPPSQNGNGKSYTSERTERTSYYRPKSAQSYFKRTFAINPEETMPIVAVEDERMIFVHTNGKTYWLDKRHPLTRYFKSSTSLPEINIIPPVESEDELGIIESIDGEPGFRYERMREICNISMKQSGENDEENEPFPTGDEERYQSRSYYTTPRNRPSIEDYFSSRHVISLYDGIDTTVFEIGENVPAGVNGVINGINETNVDSRSSNNVQGSSGSERTSGVQNEEVPDTRIEQANSSSVTTHMIAENDDTEPEDTMVVGESHVSVANGHNVISYNTDMETETEVRYDSIADTLLPNQQMLIRQTIVEHHLETDEDSYTETSNILDKSGNGQSDPLMSQLQMIHESAGIPLDTSHLDYEELQMIQKALAENPSPSPPSSPVQSPAFTDQSYPTTTRESIVVRPELGTILESPGKLQLPEMDFSPMEKNGKPEQFTFSSTDLQKSIPEESIEPSLPEVSHGVAYDEETDTYTEVYVEEITIPFPHSPNSPSKSPNPDTRSRDDSFSVTRTVTNTIEPLAIEIPENSVSSTVEYNRTGSGSPGNQSNVSPLVKSEKGSDGTHSEPSPGGSETVTTVFEEFVSTIPQDMLDTWSP